MTEPGTGSDLQSVKTKAIRDGDEYVVNGSKTFITNGAQADLVIVVAKTNPEEAASGISLIVVRDRARQGFRRGRVLDKIGMQGQDTAELFFDDVRVPAANLLGDRGGPGLRPAHAAAAAGAADHRGLLRSRRWRSALERDLRYTKDRDGVRPADLQASRTPSSSSPRSPPRPAWPGRSSTSASSGTSRASSTSRPPRWPSGGPPTRLAKVADECLQLFGGYGYMNEYPIARAWADLRVSADLRRHQRDHEGDHQPVAPQAGLTGVSRAARPSPA